MNVCKDCGEPCCVCERAADNAAMAQVCLDLHAALGVEWGADPYAEIDRRTLERDTQRDITDRLAAENAALRELMNVYNLGGWTDALGPMKRALAAEAIVLDIAKIDSPWEYYGTYDDQRCFFCGVDIRPLAQLDHDAGCAWQRAKAYAAPDSASVQKGGTKPEHEWDCPAKHTEGRWPCTCRASLTDSATEQEK
jgi:hypothetical protein